MFKVFQKSNNDKNTVPSQYKSTQIYLVTPNKNRKLDAKKNKSLFSKIHGLNWYNSYSKLKRNKEMEKYGIEKSLSYSPDSDRYS